CPAQRAGRGRQRPDRDRLHARTRMTSAPLHRHVIAGLVLGGLIAISAVFPLARAPAQTQGPAIAGQVSSAKEGPMEGVLVSVQKAGTPISITVVTDAHGRFRVPPAKLSPGNYALRIRAVGYDLDGPPAVTIPSPGAGDLRLALRKTEDLAAQFT